MDKNIIKKHLSNFVNEGAVPGITVTDKAKKESGKINKAGVKDIEKSVKSYDKDLKQKDSNMGSMAINKYNYTDDEEKEYHGQMETLNGLEMNRYSSEPGDEFRGRAQKAMEGDSTMGNKGGKDIGNAEATWGASSDDFGKKLGDRVKASQKKRDDAFIGTYELGDKIMALPDDHKVQTNTTAIGDSKYKTKGDTTKLAKTKAENKTVKENEEAKANRSIKYSTPVDGGSSEQEYDFYNSDEAKSSEKDNKKDNKKPQIQKESMKRLKFNKEFNGVGNALKLIPESYRTNNKEFEMTDGNETYRIRWEGTLSEGKAVVLAASNKTMVNEDMQRMKQLMGYKSQDTLGILRGKSRIDENAVFTDIWNKSKVLLEGEEIEGQSAQKGEWDKVKKTAKEATKDINGSTSDDKGTKAPKAKTGSMESLDDAKKHAPEAKKHIEGSVNAEIGMGLGEQEEATGEWDQINMPQAAAHGNPSKTTYAPAPKTGEWDKISVPQASDAKKHVNMHEGVVLGGVLYEPIVLKKKLN